MPLPKRIDHNDEEERREPRHLIAGFSVAAFDYVAGFFSGKPGEPPDEPDDTPYVGEYYADYSMPSREQLDAPTPELDELFAKSSVVSVKRE